MSNNDIVASGQIRSTVQTGTAPLTVDSTTLIPNMYVDRAVLADNASSVDGANISGDITVGNITAGNITVSGDQTITGNLNVTGTITGNISGGSGVSIKQMLIAQGSTGVDNIGNNMSTGTPLITEGLELYSITITPTSATSTIRIETSFGFLGSTDNGPTFTCIAGIFKTGTSAALSASIQSATRIDNEDQYFRTILQHSETSGTTSPITYSVRFGPNTAGGRIRAATNFGGIDSSWLYVTEYE